MMFSLAGIPPLAGFFAKFYVFAAAIQAGLVTLAVIGVVTSVIGAYLLHPHRQGDVFRRAAASPSSPCRPASSVVLGSASVVVVLFWLAPAPLVARRGRCRPLAVLTCGSRPRPRLPATGSSRSARPGRRTTTPSRPRGTAIRAGSGHAAEQRAGRGRHGRAWASPPGNLYASLLLVDPCEPALAPQLGFVAGLALHEAVEAVDRRRRAAPGAEMAERSAARRREGRRACCSRGTGSGRGRSRSSSASA